jgi:hypothetical protein
MILYSIGVITIMSIFSFTYKSTAYKCIKLTCGNKVSYKLISGENEAEIVSKIKTCKGTRVLFCLCRGRLQ